jgi:glycosyltransferase involved in cell wall biosynthesis
MDIWILQTGETLPIDKINYRPMRAINLSNVLVSEGHKVVLWSADFDHFLKKHRYGSNVTIDQNSNLQIKLIKSSGYRSNSAKIERLIDHALMGLNLHRLLKNTKPPDIAFVGYPPIETAWVMMKWLKKHNVPTVLDVKDGWPDTFLRVFHKKLRPIVRFLLIPYTFMMKRTFQNADSISAPTKEFLEWATSKAKRAISDNDIVVPLTLPNTDFSKNDIDLADIYLQSKGVCNDRKFRVTFIGTLNNVFDFDQVFQVASQLPIEFVIAGDGPQFHALKIRAEQARNIKLLGWIDACQSSVLIDRSSLLLAPYRLLPDFEMSIPNKFFDAMSQGLPIVTSISGTAGRLVEKNQIGFTFNIRDSSSLYSVLSKALEAPQALAEMSNKSQQLFENYFTYNQVYGALTKHLESLAMRKNV